MRCNLKWLTRPSVPELAPADGPGYSELDEFRSVSLLANIVCETRYSTELTIEDYLAGIYIGALEKVAHYWHHWEQFERLVARYCFVAEPRWMYWSRAYERRRTKKWFSIISLKTLSPNLRTVLQAATVTSSAAAQYRWPVSSRSFLLSVAIAKLPISERLLESGLNVHQLEKDLLRN